MNQKLHSNKSRVKKNTIACIMVTAECSTVPATRRMTGFSTFTLRSVNNQICEKGIMRNVLCITYVIESCATLSEIDV